MTITLADYENERRAFEALFESECHQRILLIQGDGGKGKTTLLAYCRGRVPSNVTCVHVDLKGKPPLMEVLDLIGHALGWDHLPRLSEAFARIHDLPIIQIDRNEQRGFGNRIDASVTIQNMFVQNMFDRDHRRVELTDALFKDLQALGHPVILSFDTFNGADSEVQAWIAGPMLARTVFYTSVRVVVAGRDVPEHFGASWESCCRALGLNGVREAHHWLPVIEAMGRYVDDPHPLSYTRSMCDFSKGNPAQMRTWIETLPERRDLP